MPPRSSRLNGDVPVKQFKVIEVRTKQKNLEGERLVVKEYRTEDEAPDMMSAGKLTEEGITFKFHYLAEKPDGKFGKFWIAEGKQKVNGVEQDVQLALSSTKLAKVLTRIVNDFGVSPAAGLNIRIQAFGKGFEREYKVTVL